MRISGLEPFGHCASIAGVDRISRLIAAVAESATLAIDAKAKALIAAGEDVIGFGAGEPDFATPDHIVEAAVAACRDPKNHKYTPTAGLPELREAIAEKTARDSGYVVEPAQVLVTNGGKQAVHNSFAALLDPGDEVLVPAPYWTTYPESIALAGGVRFVPDQRGDRLQGHARPARSGAHRPHQGAAVRVAVEPDRRRLPARADRGHRPLGGRARHLGRDRRDLRAPRLRRAHAALDAGRRAGPGRPLHRRQRRGQDLRDDRLARRLDDRAPRHRSRPPPTCSRTPRRT